MERLGHRSDWRAGNLVFSVVSAGRSSTLETRRSIVLVECMLNAGWLASFALGLKHFSHVSRLVTMYRCVAITIEGFVQ